MADVLKPTPPADPKKPESSKAVDAKTKKTEDEMSEEDKMLQVRLLSNWIMLLASKKLTHLVDLLSLLQEELDLLVKRLQEPDTSVYEKSLASMQNLIKASTTSMTSVPKPLKFMRQHFQTMKDIYGKINDEKTKRFCADVISVLAMTISEGRDCLNYKILGVDGDIGEWGHEYVRHLAGEIAQEW